MLPAHARLRRREDFTRVLRTGHRAGRSTLVVHASLGPQADASSLDRPGPVDGHTPSAAVAAPTRVGFVVSKAVGNAVMRHRVARQLRHLVRERLAALPPGSAVVVRALPAAAGRPSEALGRDLDAAFDRMLTPRGQAKR